MTSVRPTPARSLDQTIDIETPEQVTFSYSVAGVGSRAVAALLDTIICVFSLFAVSVLAAILFGTVRLGPAARSTPWFITVVIIAQFCILWGYYVLFEGLNDGQTPAKKWLGLRVVQDGGFSVTFASSVVRNLVRIIDLQPGFTYGVGLFSVVISRSGKRLGDLLAGTMVVRERVTKVPTAAAHAVGGKAGAAAPIATLLTDEEFALLTRFVDRRGTLASDQYLKFIAQLAKRFRDRAPEFDGLDDAGFVNALHEREKSARARGVAARSDTGAAREQHALVAAGSARWSAFATRLDHVKRVGLSKIPEREISDFVAEYRELSSDLARLKTASRGREVEATFALSRLVAAAHNIVYRQRGLTFTAALDYVTDAVPREIRRSWRPILLAAVMLFLPGAIAYVGVVRQPAVAREFIPQGMIDRAEDGVRRAKEGSGYIPDPELYRPVMASRIVANNVQVTFVAFAAGITAGIGTALLLLFNGVSLGGVFGLYQSKGILNLILAFVAPHSVLELGAICIAGGGGLLIGAAMLMPGNRTRRQALVENGRRAIKLIAGSSVFLILAGTIEGFVSPIPWWPLSWKVAVTAVSAVFFFGFIALGYHRQSAARALTSR